MTKSQIIVLKRIAHALLKISNEIYANHNQSVSFGMIDALYHEVELVLRAHGVAEGVNATANDMPLSPDYASTMVHFEELAELTSYSMKRRNAIEDWKINLAASQIQKQIRDINEDAP